MLARRSILGMFLAAFTCAACQPNTPTDTPRPTPTPAPTAVAVAPATPEEMEAIRLREAWGLRADLAFVRQLAADPAAVSEPYGVPFLPDEILEMQQRAVGREAVMTAVNLEAERAPADFCGIYVDQQHGGKVVSMWKANLHTHAINIAFDTSSFEYLAFESCTYSESELDALSDRLRDKSLANWMGSIPAVATGWGTNTLTNRVELDISSAVPGAADLVRQHILEIDGVPADMLSVTSDGTGAALRPRGTILVSVVLPNGNPVKNEDMILDWSGELAGLRCGHADMGYGITADGTATALPCEAGIWTIFVKGIPAGGDDWEVYGQGSVTVAGGQTVKLTIRLIREPPLSGQ